MIRMVNDFGDSFEPSLHADASLQFRLIENQPGLHLDDVAPLVRIGQGEYQRILLPPSPAAVSKPAPPQVPSGNDDLSVSPLWIALIIAAIVLGGLAAAVRIYWLH